MLRDEVLDEQRDVLARARAAAAGRSGRRSAGSRGRSRNSPARDQLLEVAVRRGDDPHVDPDRLRAADALELLLLEHAQELRLQVERQVADLVQEERAAVGQLEAPDPPRDGAGERAPLVAEQLALEQRRGDGGAVDLDERPLAPRGSAGGSARAISSLPVPVSPRMRTAASVAATVSTSRSTR